MKGLGAVVAALVLSLAASAQARAVTDCPLRDASFSIDSPLIDILLSPVAKAVLDKAAPGRFAKLPPRIFGTTPPTFAAIMTLREGGVMTGIRPETVADLDAQLRRIPVTPEDRIARCARYDEDVPVFDLPTGRPRLLLFEKINGFKDEPSVTAAHAAFLAMAERKGWVLATTDRGGAFNPRTLGQFDAVIWNNVSGDVLTLSQRRAFKAWMEKGGAFIGVHGSAGDPAYFWDWYADRLLGARFKGHPMAPQYQDARVVVNRSHPIALALPADWTMSDEWYSFRTNPREVGANVVASLDEESYSPIGMMRSDLRMGDHPIAWTNCVGRGRMFYSAIGHRPEAYAHPNYVTMLEAAVKWAALSGRRGCRG